MCFVRLTELLETDWFKQKKAEIVFIGNGSAQVGKGLGEELGVFKNGARLLVDDSVDSVVYNALGAKRGILRTFTLTRFDNFVGLFSISLQLLKGRIPSIPMLMHGAARKPDSCSGDPYWQGAVFVFDENQQLRYRQIEQTPGNPKTDFRALRKVVEDGARIGVISVKPNPSSSFFSTNRLFISCVMMFVSAALLHSKLRGNSFNNKNKPLK